MRERDLICQGLWLAGLSREGERGSRRRQGCATMAVKTRQTAMARADALGVNSATTTVGWVTLASLLSLHSFPHL